MQDVSNSNRLQEFYNKFSTGQGFYTPVPMSRFTIYAMFYPNNLTGESGNRKLNRSFVYDLMISKNGSIINDLTYFVQDISLPNYHVDEGGNHFKTILGNVIVNSEYVTTESNILSMRVINTKTSVLDNIFYPWLRETTLPCWSYETQPFTTAKIMISMRDTDIAYIFTGVRPTRIENYHPTHARDTDMTREVNFAFNHMYITNANAMGEGLLTDKNTEANYNNEKNEQLKNIAYAQTKNAIFDDQATYQYYKNNNQSTPGHNEYNSEIKI